MQSLILLCIVLGFVGFLFAAVFGLFAAGSPRTPHAP
jgi:hypothetical protein